MPGLKLTMEDFDIDLVRYIRELKEVNSWTLADELSDIAGEVVHGYPVPLLMRMIRICNVKDLIAFETHDTEPPKFAFYVGDRKTPLKP